MTDQLQLVSGGVSMPPRPSATALLRGYCPTCGKWPKAGETTGKLFSHKPTWRIANEPCAGSGKRPTNYRWLEPLQ
jgi:hypothetical protein